MASPAEISLGMPVFGADARPIGTVEEVGDDGIRAGGQVFPREAIARVAEGGVHLKIAASALAARPVAPAAEPVAAPAGDQEQLVVPLAEERLVVGTRQVELGEVEIRKRVVEETVMQPVTVRREVVEVVRRDEAGNEIAAEEIAPRPAEPQAG